ncbi:putative phage protein [Candidatus Hepatincola sp. Av]
MGILNLGEKVIDKYTSEKEELEQANEIIKNTKELDLSQHQARNNLNLKNPRFWLEIICITGFAYSYLIAPVASDLWHINLHGAGKETEELLYALMGLGGYRLAEKVVKK